MIAVVVRGAPVPLREESLRRLGEVVPECMSVTCDCGEDGAEWFRVDGALTECTCNNCERVFALVHS